MNDYTIVVQSRRQYSSKLIAQNNLVTGRVATRSKWKVRVI